MKKLNSIIYKKLQLQAEEAEEQGMIKLASAVFDAIGDEYYGATLPYSPDQLQNDIHQDLWKIATKLITYHNLNSANIEKIDDVLLSWSEKITNDLEKTFNVNNNIKGPLEPLLAGEIK